MNSNSFDAFLRWFATSQLASILRVALALIVNNMIADWVKVGNFDVSNWKAWLIAAGAACLPMILRWINPADPLGRAKG